MKPDISFKLLRLDISDMVDAEVAGAHYETWRQHRDALQAVEAVQLKPSCRMEYRSAKVAQWQPLVRQSYAGRVIDRLKSLKKFLGNGYTFADAWYLAGKFN